MSCNIASQPVGSAAFPIVVNLDPAVPNGTVISNTASATNVVTALLMLPEPVNSTTKQFEAKLNFAGEKLNISGGYYGSFFTNSNGNLTATVPGILNNPFGGTGPLAPAVAGGTSLQNVMQMPTALPPDNQAHQIYVSGNYAFTPTTAMCATFRYRCQSFTLVSTMPSTL